MEVPSWTLFFLGLTTFAHLTQFMACGAGGPSQSGSLGDTFDTLQSYATFTGCSGGANYWTAALFTVFTLPWLLILAGFLFGLFNNAVTGTVVGALALITGLIALFA